MLTRARTAVIGLACVAVLGGLGTVPAHATVSAAAPPAPSGSPRGISATPASLRPGAVALSTPDPTIAPANNIAENPVEPASCAAAATTCAVDGVRALNHARAVLGQPAYVLPDTFYSLTPGQQLLVLSNADRTLYGLAPIIGLTAELNASAVDGVAADGDPDFVTVVGAAPQAGGSNWAAGFGNAIYAYYNWMYVDGVGAGGSGNIDCLRITDAGCWGHRRNTLMATPAGSQLAMGVGVGPSPSYYNGGYTELYEAFDAAVNIPYIPVITGLAPASGPTAGGTAVTINGFGLAGVSAVRFGAPNAGFSAAAGLSVVATAPAGLGVVDVTVTTPGGTSALTVGDRYTYVGPGPATEYHPIAPTRLFDTRPSRAIPANGVLSVVVRGRAGVPADGVYSVALNVTVLAGGSPGYITAYPGHTVRPTASNLNFAPGQIVANLVVASPSANGTVDFYNGSGRPVQLVGDLAGYFATAVAPTDPGIFQALAPGRVLDTRAGIGVAAARVGPNRGIALPVVGRAGIPAGTASVVLNVTVTNPTSSGYIAAYSSGVPRPTVSSLNFTPGQTVPNLVVVPVGPDGSVMLFNSSGGTVDLVADVAGVFAPGPPTAPGQFGGLPISRLLDTRAGNGAPVRQLGAHQTLVLQVTGRGGVPAGAAGAILNVTATTVSVAGYLTVYGGGARPPTSNLNLVHGRVVPNLVFTPLASDGTVRIYNGSGAALNVVADLAGYFA